MVARIRSDDPTGVEEFFAAYRLSIRFLMSRRLGQHATETLIEETLGRAVQGIREGWLDDRQDLVWFLRRRLERERAPAAARSYNL